MLQDIRLAIIVNPELPPGHLANTIAAISIGIGSAMPDLGNRQLTDSREYDRYQFQPARSDPPGRQPDDRRIAAQGAAERGTPHRRAVSGVCALDAQLCGL